MTDLNALKVANAKRWKAAKLTRDFSGTARRLVAASAKAQYQAVEKLTGVPWFFIAIVHEREASQSWSGSLAQGDPWNAVSVHVPRGRGPFVSWQAAAVDALDHCAPFAGRNTDWSIGGLLTMAEEYNGLGYAAHGVPSPYVWSGTDQYRSGKYVRDGVYDPSVVDKQLGCAGLLMAMMALDPTITFTGAVLTPTAPKSTPSVAQSTPKPTQSTPSGPSITNPAKGSIGAFIASILAAIFKRKS